MDKSGDLRFADAGVDYSRSAAGFEREQHLH